MGPEVARTGLSRRSIKQAERRPDVSEAAAGINQPREKARARQAERGERKEERGEVKAEGKIKMRGWMGWREGK